VYAEAFIAYTIRNIDNKRTLERFIAATEQTIAEADNVELRDLLLEIEARVVAAL
jgi:hypothetical protein